MVPIPRKWIEQYGFCNPLVRARIKPAFTTVVDGYYIIQTDTTAVVINDTTEQYRICFRPILYFVEKSDGNMFLKVSTKYGAEVEMTSIVTEY